MVRSRSKATPSPPKSPAASPTPISDAYGGERFGLRLKAVVDRDKFGISWNNALPSGEPALSNQVTITADLQLSKKG
jgi:hypothetical protein